MADSSNALSPAEKILQLRKDAPSTKFFAVLLFAALCEPIAIGLAVLNISSWFPAILVITLCVLAGVCLVLSIWERPIEFDCPNCGGRLYNLISWACGYCGNVHPRPEFAWGRSFLRSCSDCGSSPKGYRCVHCSAIVRLQSGDLTRFAYTPNRPAPQEPEAIQTPRPPAVEDSPITRMLRPIQDRQQRREALMQYERQTRQAIQDRGDLNDEEKEELLNELTIDIEQARMLDG